MSKLHYCALVTLMAFGFLPLCPALSAAPSASSGRGVVTSSDGKPMEGVVISARAEGKTITTSVYSDRDGRYLFPGLDAGQYKVWAQAVGFETDRATVTFAAGKDVEKNFMLKPLMDFSRQLTGSEWMASLPDDTPADRRLKRIMGVNCDTCHTLGTVLQNQFDATGWRAILNIMEKIQGSLPVAAHDSSGQPGVVPYIHGYKDELIDYLTKVRGPASAPLNYKAFPRPSGEATQIVVTEYDVPPGHLPDYHVVNNGSDWSLGTPTHYESRAAHDVVLDHDGNAWFSDADTPKRTLGKLDPKTGRVTDYTELDNKNLPVPAHDLVTDQAGNIWFSNGSESSIDKFDPKTEKFQHFPRTENTGGAGGGFLRVDSKGNLWNAAGGKSLVDIDPASGLHYLSAKPDPLNPGGALELDPKTGKYTLYKTDTPGGGYYGAIPDAEDNIWFTKPGLDRIEVLDRRMGEVSGVDLGIDYDSVPYTDKDKELASRFIPSSQSGSIGHKGPRRGAADLNGNTVWYGESQGNRLAKIDIHTRQVKEYLMPYQYVFPYAIGVDTDHMVWITSVNSDRLYKFNPSTEKFTVYRLPSLGTDIRYIAIDSGTNPSTLWLAYWGVNKIARIQFRTAAPAVAAR